MVKENRFKELSRTRGIYILPNLFTVGALFAGFYAIVAATKQHFEIAAIAILVATILDMLDGRIARLTHSQSAFGAQMDNLSDMVCFGVTPSLVLYYWSLSALGKTGWLIAFFYCVCTMLRLSRFAAQSQSTNKRYFQGLSTTATAAFVASLIWVGVTYDIDGKHIAVVMGVITILLGLLKVSTVRYRSFKDFDLRSRVPFVAVLILVLVFVFVSFDPPDVLLVLLSLYVFSGPISTLWQLRQKRRVKRLKKSSKNLPRELSHHEK